MEHYIAVESMADTAWLKFMQKNKNVTGARDSFD